MPTIEIRRIANLDGLQKPDSLTGVVFGGESKAHKFIISAIRGGQAVELTGNVSARFIRANDTTILLSEGYAELVNGEAVVTLHQDCYNVPGRFQLSIFATDGEDAICVYSGVGVVQRSTSGEMIDSGDVVPTLEQLLEQIDECRDAAADARAAASSAVRYDTAQSLTDAQQARALENIGAASGGLVETIHNLIDYGYSTGETLAATTSPHTYAVEQDGTELHLNSTSATGATSFLRLSDTLSRVSGTSQVRAWTGGVTLKPGHVYRINGRLVGGTVSITDAAPYISIYENGSSSTLSFLRSATGNYTHIWRIFTAGSTPVNVSLNTPTGVTYTNAVYQVYLEDITDCPECKNLAPSDTPTASDTHSPGDLLTVGGTLYKATQAIAPGTVITPGTNVTETTVAEHVAEQIAPLTTTIGLVTETGENLYNGKLYNYGFSAGKLVDAANCRSFVWPVTAGEYYTLSRASTASPDRIRVGFLKTNPVDGLTVYSLRGQAETINDESKGMFDALTLKTFQVPAGCVYGVMYMSNVENEPDDGTELMLVKGRTAGTWTRISQASAIDTVARDTAKNIVDRNDPDKMLAKLQQMNRPERTGSRTLGTPPLCLIHFSDIHGDEYCLRNVAAFWDHYRDMIADVIHTGDSVTTYAGDGMAFWNHVEDASRFLNVIGNHDARKLANSWTSVQTAAESRAAYVDPYVDRWGVTIGSGVNYYYKDYSANKIRLIVLDVMHDDATQRAWFVSTLAGAKSSGYHVIGAAHCMASKYLTPFVTPWDDKPVVPWYEEGFPTITGVNYPEWLDSSYVDAVEDFKNGGGHFVCWLHGHVHAAMFAKVTGTNQLNIGVGNAGGPGFAWTYAQARQQGTRNADDFNVFAVDSDSGILRIVKVCVENFR